METELVESLESSWDLGPASPANAGELVTSSVSLAGCSSVADWTAILGIPVGINYIQCKKHNDDYFCN